MKFLISLMSRDDVCRNGQLNDQGPFMRLIRAGDFEEAHILCHDEAESAVNELIARSNKFSKKSVFPTASDSGHTPRIRYKMVRFQEVSDLSISTTNLEDEINRLLSGRLCNQVSIHASTWNQSTVVALTVLVNSGRIPGKLVHCLPSEFSTSSAPEISELVVANENRSESRPPSVANRNYNSEERILSAREAVKAVGCHPVFEALLNNLYQCSQISDFHLLLRGEPGVGKATLARFVCDLGRPDSGVLEVVDCNLPVEVVKKLLFAPAQGALYRANGGYLYLKNIDALSNDCQALLIDVLARPSSQNIRLLASTSKDINLQVGEGRFRSDLLGLFAGGFEVPSLKERHGDIAILAKYFLDRWNRLNDRNFAMSTNVLRALDKHKWVGNVTELRSVIESSAQLVQGDLLDWKNLRLVSAAASLPRIEELSLIVRDKGLPIFLESVKRAMVIDALGRHQWNVAATASSLEMTRQALDRYCKDRGIKKP